MIEVKIPKEINTYEAKLIGPFTARQTIALAIALPACVILYNSLGKVLPIDTVVGVLFIPGGLAFLFGWFKPYGMHFEQFMSKVFISAFVAPSKRKYKTENYYTILADQIEKAELEEASKAVGKKTQKKKYRRSKDAIL